jgi:hypothetical protein
MLEDSVALRLGLKPNGFFLSSGFSRSCESELREGDCSSPWAVPYRRLLGRIPDTFGTLVAMPTRCTSSS